MKNIRVCTAIYEQDSEGEACETDLIECDNLRDAIAELFRTRTNKVGGIECIESSNSGFLSRHDWLTVYNSAEFETGCHEQRSLHIDCTPSSKGRLFKLLRGN